MSLYKMDQVMLLKNGYPDIGLYTRNTTPGSEYRLVEQFIDYYCSVFLRGNKKTQLAVFVEPRIDSGFPDVVFASYLPSITDNWSEEREKLDIFDLKLLSYIFDVKTVKGTTIITKLGFPEKQTIASLTMSINNVYASLLSFFKFSFSKVFTNSKNVEISVNCR